MKAKIETKVSRPGSLHMVRRLRNLPKPIADLYAAIDQYVKAGQGTVVIVGGIEVQKWSHDPEFVFRVAVKCMGRQPKFVPPNAELCHKPDQKTL